MQQNHPRRLLRTPHHKWRRLSHHQTRKRPVERPHIYCQEENLKWYDDVISANHHFTVILESNATLGERKKMQTEVKKYVLTTSMSELETHSQRHRHLLAIETNGRNWLGDHLRNDIRTTPDYGTDDDVWGWNRSITNLTDLWNACLHILNVNPQNLILNSS